MFIFVIDLAGIGCDIGHEGRGKGGGAIPYSTKIMPVLWGITTGVLCRKNLAIERMIVEGCDILLDVNQEPKPW